MTHSVQLVIGRGEAVAQFVRACSARAVDLHGGWQAVPIDDAVHARIEASARDGRRPPELDASPLGLEAALQAVTATGGALAYVETEYWGGTGGQSAVAYVDGREAVAPQRADGSAGPINEALRAIGVRRTGGKDEFDTIGLGERRTMDDYSPEGPRLFQTGASVATPARGLSTWIVLLIVAAAIAIGVGVAAMR